MVMMSRAAAAVTHTSGGKGTRMDDDVHPEPGPGARARAEARVSCRRGAPHMIAATA